MESFNTEIENASARRSRRFKRGSFLLPFVLALAFVIIFKDSFNAEQLLFSLSTCAVALILAGTYYYAYKFFTENFYFYLFVSWVANAVYLLPDLNGPSGEVEGSGFFYYKIGVYVLSVVATLFMLVALFNLGANRPANLRRLVWVVTAVGLLGMGVGYAVALNLSNPNLRLLAVIKLPGALLTFVVVCLVGIVLRYRVSNEAAGAKGYILLYTFYLYGTIQFIGPFSPTIKKHWGDSWYLFFFLVGQLAKVGNAIAMTGVLQAALTDRDLVRAREAMKAMEAQQEVALMMEKQQAALKLEEANVEKRKQFVELGMLASSIKHDVSTPLATMGFDIGVLKERYQHEKGIIKKLENLEYSMERIHAIVKVVDFFRGDQGFFDRDQYMTKVNMLELVHRAVRSIKNEKKELKQVNPKNKILVDGRDVWVRAYAPMFEQVIVNIIKNGLEAIEEAGQERGIVKINVSAPEAAGGPYARWVRVEIEDNGVGIPEENMKKLGTTIFTTRGDKKANSGIGLFIGRKIVDIHSGKLEFESTVGKGTKVTLLLPEWTALQRAEQRVHESGPEADGGSARSEPMAQDVSEPAPAADELELIKEETYE